MKYRLLKDCPHGEAGSVWEMVFQGCVAPHNGERFHELELQGGSPRWKFPKSTFSNWFEEIREMKKFTEKQREALENFIQRHRFFHGNDRDGYAVGQVALQNWLDENTEI